MLCGVTLWSRVSEIIGVIFLLMVVSWRVWTSSAISSSRVSVSPCLFCLSSTKVMYSVRSSFFFVAHAERYWLKSYDCVSCFWGAVCALGVVGAVFIVGMVSVPRIVAVSRMIPLRCVIFKVG